MNNKAFTLAEVLICLSVIGVIAVISLRGLLSPDFTNEKKIAHVSKSFYNSIESGYYDFLMNLDMQLSTGKNMGLNNKQLNHTSAGLREYFVDYANGQTINCNDLKLIATYNPANRNNAQCAKFENGILAAFYYGNSANYKAKEYYDGDLYNPTAQATPGKEKDHRSAVKNGNGYVYYEFDISNRSRIENGLPAHAFLIVLGPNGVR